jgi:DNA-directed RNA polymerase subunit RPC12/RpoP
MDQKCPGSILVKEPIPEIFKCLNCGADVEIWTNELTRKCSSCGESVSKELTNMACVQWCKQAKECIGATRYNELVRTGIISSKKEEINIPERLKEFMKKCGIPIPNN